MDPNEPAPAPPRKRAVSHPDAYCWLILISSLDIITTRIVLQFGGAEANPIAARFIGLAGHWGLIALKFAMIVLVIVICEHIAARRPRVARRLALGAIALSTVPVLIGLSQLAAHIAASEKASRRGAEWNEEEAGPQMAQVGSGRCEESASHLVPSGKSVAAPLVVPSAPPRENPS